MLAHTSQRGIQGSSCRGTGAWLHSSQTKRSAVTAPTVTNGRHACAPKPQATTATQAESSRVEPSKETLKRLLDNFLVGYEHSQHVEHAYWIEDSMVEGIIPAELRGTLLRNGPGLFEIGDKRIAQPFDGDGMVCTFSFEEGRAYFQNKFVRTKGFVEEQRAGKSLYRSAFNKGGNEGEWFANPFDFSVKNIANTNVVRWGGKTLALYERGLPHLLREDLSTAGEDDLDGSVDGNKFFGAHYRVFTEADGSQRLVAFSFGEALSDALITVWEYDEQWRCLHKIKRTLPGAAFGFFHDIAVTENHYVLLQNPIKLNMWRLLTEYTRGKACIAECLEFDSKLPVKVILIPRPGRGKPAGPEAVRSYELRGSPFFTFHHINAYEWEGGRYVVVDTCAADNIDFSLTTENPSTSYYEDPANCDKLSRVVLDTATGKVVRHALGQRNCDLPAMDQRRAGQPHRHMYTYAALVDHPTAFSPPQGLWKVSLEPSAGVTAPLQPADIKSEYWSGGEHKIGQEPVFVPRPGGTEEDDGWVLQMVYDTRSITSQLVILDARDISAGPVATISLPHHIPLGLHGSFSPDVVLPQDPQYRSTRQEYSIKSGV